MSDERSRAFLKTGTILIIPPVFQVAVGVIARPLIIKTMSDFVANDRADRPEVLRLISIRIKEGGLQNGRGEDDLIHWRVVVGVDRLRGHEPLAAIHGLPELCPLVFRVESGCHRHILQQGCPTQGESGVVAPPVGVADLRHEGVELGQCPLTRGFAHPLRSGQSIAIGIEESRNEGIHFFFVRGREMAFHPDAPHGLTQEAVHQGKRTLPAGAQFFCSRQRAPVERKACVNKIR